MQAANKAPARRRGKGKDDKEPEPLATEAPPEEETRPSEMPRAVQVTISDVRTLLLLLEAPQAAAAEGAGLYLVALGSLSQYLSVGADSRCEFVRLGGPAVLRSVLANLLLPPDAIGSNTSSSSTSGSGSNADLLGGNSSVRRALLGVVAQLAAEPASVRRAVVEAGVLRDVLELLLLAAGGSASSAVVPPAPQQPQSQPPQLLVLTPDASSSAVAAASSSLPAAPGPAAAAGGNLLAAGGSSSVHAGAATASPAGAAAAATAATAPPPGGDVQQLLAAGVDTLLAYCQDADTSRLVGERAGPLLLNIARSDGFDEPLRRRSLVLLERLAADPLTQLRLAACRAVPLLLPLLQHPGLAASPLAASLAVQAAAVLSALLAADFQGRLALRKGLNGGPAAGGLSSLVSLVGSSSSSGGGAAGGVSALPAVVVAPEPVVAAVSRLLATLAAADYAAALEIGRLLLILPSALESVLARASAATSSVSIRAAALQLLAAAAVERRFAARCAADSVLLSRLADCLLLPPSAAGSSSVAPAAAVPPTAANLNPLVAASAPSSAVPPASVGIAGSSSTGGAAMPLDPAAVDGTAAAAASAGPAAVSSVAAGAAALVANLLTHAAADGEAVAALAALSLAPPLVSLLSGCLASSAVADPAAGSAAVLLPALRALSALCSLPSSSPAGAGAACLRSPPGLLDAAIAAVFDVLSASSAVVNGTGRRELRALAASILAALAESPQCAADMRSALLARPLAPLLSLLADGESSDCIRSALAVVARLAIDGIGRQLLVRDGCLPCLSPLLDARDPLIARDAVWALDILVRLPEAALEACEGDVLATLMQSARMTTDDADSNPARQRLASDAVRSCVKHYMPAKFWATNALEVADKLAVGFFDCGQRKHWAPLRTLLQETVSSSFTEVLLVDSNPDAAWVASLIASSESPMIVAANLAAFVSERFGGAIEYQRYDPLYYLAGVNRLRHQLQSNVCPLSRVGVGAARHRALLFKACADVIGLDTRLVRGSASHGQAHLWNVLIVNDSNSSGGVNASSARSYVVDLLHDVGQLLPEGCAEAIRYMRVGRAAE